MKIASTEIKAGDKVELFGAGNGEFEVTSVTVDPAGKPAIWFKCFQYTQNSEGVYEWWPKVCEPEWEYEVSRLGMY